MNTPGYPVMHPYLFRTPAWILFLWWYTLLCGCTPRAPVPVRVDTATGQFTWEMAGNQIGPVTPVVHGVPVLQQTFRYEESGGLYFIRSAGQLDIITRFRGDSGMAAMEVRLVNTGDTNLKINQVRLFSMPQDCGFDPVLADPGTLVLSKQGKPSLKYRITFGHDPAWPVSFDLSGGQVIGGISLRQHGVILLPKEVMQVPAVWIMPMHGVH